MRFRLTPETKFTFSVDDEIGTKISFVKEKLVGNNTFEIETLFGMREILYHGVCEGNQINLTRSIDYFYKLPIYPTSRITFSLKENSTLIKVRCSLSSSWTVFIYCTYFFIFLGVILGWFHSTSTQSIIILLFKMLGSIFILNVLIFGYHFSEVKNVKNIIKGVVDRVPD